MQHIWFLQLFKIYPRYKSSPYLTQSVTVQSTFELITIQLKINGSFIYFQYKKSCTSKTIQPAISIWFLMKWSFRSEGNCIKQGLFIWLIGGDRRSFTINGKTFIFNVTAAIYSSVTLMLFFSIGLSVRLPIQLESFHKTKNIHFNAKGVVVVMMILCKTTVDHISVRTCAVDSVVTSFSSPICEGGMLWW